MNHLLMLLPTSNIAILGFGARAAGFAALLAPRGCALRAWDPALASAHDAAMRASIEAAGVDCMAELSRTLRGARLVVLDTVPMTAWLAAQLQEGQLLLDLATAPAADIDAVLAALGLPHGATAVRTMANSAAAIPGTPRVRRGELP
jgi:3-hydroxyacyl-CoA dehydrogenase